MEKQAGFKKTEIGFIPSDWDVIRVGSVFQFKNGLNKEKKYFGQGTPIVNYMDVYKYNGIRAKLLHGRVTLSIQEIKNYGAQKGDVFFTRTSETVEEIGISSVVLEELENTVFSGFVLRGRPFKDVFVIEFCQFCFLSKLVRKQILTTASYTTRALTNGRLLSDIKIPLPPIKAEQTAIATALNDADALINQLERLIAKKRAIKQGTMQELLKPKEGWEIFTFNRVFKKLKGKHCQIQTKEYQHSGKYPVIDQGKDRIVAFSDNSSKLFPCPNEGLIVFGDHTREIKFIDFDFVIGADGTQLLSVDKEHSLKFFYYQLLLNEVPNTGYNRHFKFLLEMSFKVPEKSEQSHIAQILSDLDAEVEALEKKLEKYRMLKQGMMQNLLTGKIRLV